MAGTPQILTYHSDAPISDPAEDAFERWPFAQRIGDTIATRTDPASLCIGIYGQWGEGKTTVLRFIERHLSGHTDIRIIHFNPWRFRTEEDLFMGFFGALAAGIGGSIKTRRERAAKAVAPYTKLLGPVSVGAFGVHVSAAELAKNLAEAATADVETLKGRLDNLIKESKKKLIIFVDDVDRMDRAQVHAVFKLIKACGDFLYTTYVLAFDDRAIAAALGTQYGEGDIRAGRDFLEKIVQVPLHVPAASDASLHHFCLAEVDRVLAAAHVELSEDEAQAFVNGFDRGFGRALTTPRMAKRYSNALAFALPLLAREVSTVDLLLVEAMRVSFPTLYEFVKVNSDTMLAPATAAHNRQATADLVSAAIETLEARHRADAKRLLLALFPRLQSVFGNFTYGSESEIAWARSKRVCARDYFQRYFSYAVAKGDIPEREINSLCSAAEQNNAKVVREHFKTLLSAETAESLLTKLSYRDDELSPPVAAILAKEFSKYGALFSRTGGFARLSLFTRAGGLVAALVERSPKGKQRTRVAEQVLRNATPLGFAAECLSWFRAGRDRPEEERIFSDDDANASGKILADQINSAAECNLIRDEANLLMLMYVWDDFGYSGAPRKLLEKCLEKEPDLVSPFLRSAVGMAYPSDGGRPHPGDFEQDAYSAVLRYADPAKIYAAVVKLFGDQVSRAPQLRRGVENSDQRIAQQFVAVHNRKPPSTTAATPAGTENRRSSNLDY
jgi:hypothetical protein